VEARSPRYLYKYHELNLHLMEMLTNAEFHSSSRTELNDPLDLAYTMSLENYLNLYHEKHPYLKNDPKHTELVSSIFKWKIDEGDNSWMDDVDDVQSKARVICFTEDGNNPLMWSHYANNHTGVCLKFEPEKDPSFAEALAPVQYSDELIDAKSMSDFTRCLLTKLRAWETEKEWRIVTDKERFPFTQETLVEIVFGLRVRESTITWFEKFRENVYFMDTAIHRLKIRGSRLVKVDRWGLPLRRLLR
jgi:hypothetical protein